MNNQFNLWMDILFGVPIWSILGLVTFKIFLWNINLFHNNAKFGMLTITRETGSAKV